MPFRIFCNHFIEANHLAAKARKPRFRILLILFDKVYIGEQRQLHPFAKHRHTGESEHTGKREGLYRYGLSAHVCPGYHGRTGLQLHAYGNKASSLFIEPVIKHWVHHARNADCIRISLYAGYNAACFSAELRLRHGMIKHTDMLYA